MSENASKTESFDPEKYRPSPESVKSERQTYSLVWGAMAAMISGMVGYMAAEWQKCGSQTKGWITGISAVAGGLIGGYILGKKTETEGEVIYKMAQEAAKRPDPEKAMQDGLAKREKDKEMLMAMAMIDQANQSANANANYFQTYANPAAGGGYGGMGRF